MKICVVGTGYVGLVVGTCLAETGNHVTCVDQNHEKIQSLKDGGVPIYEPGLEDLLHRNDKEGRLLFSTDFTAAVRDSYMIFVTVGTPSTAGGKVDLQYVLGVARDIAKAMNDEKVIVIKSTVPCGTAERVEKVLAEHSQFSFDVVANPEFLKEGVAVEDFMKPDRVVIGLKREGLKAVFQRLYAPFLRTGKPIIFMDPASAEMTKYASNGLLALRISYINEIANLCDVFGADVAAVRHGMGADERIGHSFLFPGVGFGGSCFPKDVDALIQTANEKGRSIRTLEACAEVNRLQQGLLAEKIVEFFSSKGFEDLAGKKIAIWGLSFKPRTDDMREAPAIRIIEKLIDAKATVAAFDPVAMDQAKQIFRCKDLPVQLTRSYYEAVKDAHALALVTEWNEFRRPDLYRLRELMAEPNIFDGRNIFEPSEMKDLGFTYQGIGRRS